MKEYTMLAPKIMEYTGVIKPNTDISWQHIVTDGDKKTVESFNTYNELVKSEEVD